MKKRLTTEEGRKETRFIYTMLAIILVIVGMALYGWLTGSWEAQGQEVTKYEQRLIESDKRALEDAYHDQLKLLFSVWLKDDVAATQRISKGLGIARRAYAAAAEQIERREQALKR